MGWFRVAFTGVSLVVAMTPEPARAHHPLDFDEKTSVVEDWTAGYNKANNVCLASVTYSDQTTLWLGMDRDGDFYLGLTNPDWQSIERGKGYSTRITAVGGTRWNVRFEGLTRDTEKGIISGALKNEFVRDLVRSPGIAVAIGSREIAKLSLAGSPAALTALQECRTARGSPGATPSVTNRSGKRVVGNGTGFYVTGSGHILTNSHVIESCSSIGIEQFGQPRVQAALLARDKTNDLAVLKAGTRPPAVAAIRTDLRVGENIAVYGFPLSDSLSTSGNFTVGYVSALAGLNDDTTNIQISAPIQPGNSGGPVFDQHGNAVAVIVATATASIMKSSAGVVAPQNINFAIKSSVAKMFLESNGVVADGATQNQQVYQFADLAERARQNTVKVLCEK